MDQPRFYCPQLTTGVVALDERESRHALQSLRLRPGDQVTLFDGQGRLAPGTLQVPDAATQHATPRRSKKRPPSAAVAVERILTEPAPTATLTLLVAGCKGARLDWLVEKCTELGASHLVLTEFERSVVHTGTRHVAKLLRTAIEASKQSGRLWLPRIDAGVTLADAIAERRAATLLVAHPDDDAPLLGDWIGNANSPGGELAVVVGPEGGLTPDELAVLRAAGATAVRLAPHILRVETAAVAVCANWAAC